MKVTDYIVEFLQRKGIHDFFGYQGTMIAHLVDSIEKNPHTRSHSSYHEQGAAFAACGYAQAGERCACAYATSGPGGCESDFRNRRRLFRFPSRFVFYWSVEYL